MQCPECKGDVPQVHSFCPHCRAVMPAVLTSYDHLATDEAATDGSSKSARKPKAAKKQAASQKVQADFPHYSKLFHVAWQTMQVILACAALLGAFVAYKRVDWQSAANRVNEAANPTQPAQAAEAEAVTVRTRLADKPKVAKTEGNGKPVATQASASAGLLIVKSQATARIYVDGKFAGTTPHSFTMSAGEHQLMLIAEGYQEWTRAIVVRGNQQVGIMAALQKLPVR